jgi:DDE superfamily endonuclease
MDRLTTDNELGIRWLKECFELETRLAPRKSRILIMDGYASYISIEALKFYIASNIIVLCLPSHSTHITQPLDVGIFQLLVIAYSKGVLERGEYSPIYSIDKLQFLEIY